MNSYLQNNTFIGFLDPKNLGKEISFIIIACFVILHYVSSGHFEKMAKKHVFTRGILLDFFFGKINKNRSTWNLFPDWDILAFVASSISAILGDREKIMLDLDSAGPLYLIFDPFFLIEIVKF